MKIAILSDTHDRLDRVERALAEVRRRGVRTVIHCGDIVSPAVVAPFAGLDAHFVLGNCDSDGDALRAAIGAAGGTLHDGFGHLELLGKAIAFTHGDDQRLMLDLVNSRAYDYLFHGHTHVAAERQAGPTRVINPGALQRVKVPTFLVLDLASGDAETVEVPA